MFGCLRGKKVLKIYGQSDDLVELEGIFHDEIGCYDETVTLQVGTEKAGVVVEMFYENDGCWSAKIKRIDDGVPIPWAISVVPMSRIDGREGYSVAVEIACPEGTPIRRLNAPKDED
jgi:hypothetical protein